MSKWDQEQKRIQQQDEYYRMRPSLTTRSDGRPNPHHQPSPYRSSSGGGGSNTGGCFPAGTLIDTPHGPRDISSLRKGDLVVTVDVSTGARGRGRVLKVMTHDRRRLWQFTFADGRQVTTTAVHSFFVNGRWRTASKVAPGDVLSTSSGKTGVSGVVRESCEVAGVADVYNLVVSRSFTFVADGTVAHCFTYLRTLRTQVWRGVVGARAAAEAVNRLASALNGVRARASS